MSTFNLNAFMDKCGDYLTYGYSLVFFIWAAYFLIPYAIHPEGGSSAIVNAIVIAAVLMLTLLFNLKIMSIATRTLGTVFGFLIGTAYQKLFNK